MPRPSPGIHIAVVIDGRQFEAAARLAVRTLRAALRRKRITRAALEVYIVSDAAMCEINRRTRGIDEPTTVLSFPADPSFPYPPTPGVPYRGEVYLAPWYIRSRGEELPHLAVHALLHLLGYTHERSHDTIEMEEEERRLLDAPKVARHKQQTNNKQ